jgi:tetrahydromethanopterin S-methyltransferase subunit B
MDTLISRAEHEEFCKRMESEDKRQNRRIELLEESVRQISSLTLSVEKLASNMENMLKEQGKQGKRLEALENRDGEKWRKVTGYVITAVIGIIVGFIFKQIGM